jgi:putative Mg2+ transporter-C (MgtC) family protein
VIAGVATGVGFIGAGLVWRGRGRDVHGLTTAAAMWAMVAVGVIAGIGRPGFAAGIALVVLILLELPFAPFARYIEPRRFRHRFRKDPEARPMEEPPPADAQ